MKMYEAAPGHWIPEGQTLDSMDNDRSNGMDTYERAFFVLATATVWVTREGQQIAVRDMGDQHLVNTIRMLRRIAPLVPLMMISECLQMDRYIVDAPDGAAMACEAEAAALSDMTDDEYLNRHYVTLPAMLAEAEKRGLQL